MPTVYRVSSRDWYQRPQHERDRLRDARPDLAIASDFIAGHPGETDADAEATLDLIRRVGFVQSYSFAYSPRPGTPAAGAPGQVPAAVKDARLQALQALLRDQAAAFNKATEGKTLPVLFTGPGRRPGQLSGRSPFLQPVHVDASPALIGQVVPVTIMQGSPTSLSGTLIQELIPA